MPNINIASPIGAWTQSQISEAFNEVRRQFIPLISESQSAARLRLRSSLGEPYEITVGTAGGLEVRNAGGTLMPTVVGSVSLAASAVTAQSAGSLSAPRIIDATGDVTGSVSTTFSGTTTLPLTLAGSGVAAGTYDRVTVDAKGRVTAGVAELPAEVRLAQTVVSTSTASVTFVLPAGWSSYRLVYDGVRPSADAFLQCQFSVDGGATWLTTNYANGYVFNGASTASGSQAFPTAGVFLLPTVGASLSTLVTGSGEGRLFVGSAARSAQFFGQATTFEQSNAVWLSWNFVGALPVSAPVNALRILSATGNILEGRFTLIGVR